MPTCVVLGLLEAKVLLQMKGFSICYVYSVQEGQEIHDADEGEDMPVDPSYDFSLSRVRRALNAEFVIVGIGKPWMIRVARKHLIPFLLVETRARCQVG
jgi:hypothetical protein